MSPRRILGTLFIASLVAGLAMAADDKMLPPGQVVAVSAAPAPVAQGEGPVLRPLWVDEPCSEGGFYGGAEYLIWWLRGDALPPLVTFGSFSDAPFAGALGEPGTALAFGGNHVSTDAHSGIRLTVGYALDRDGELAVEASYFLLEQRSQLYNAALDGSNPLLVIAQPYFNTLLNREDSLVVAGPTVPGGLAVELRDRFQGAELNLRAPFTDFGALRVGLLGGFRFLDLDESLNVASFTEDPSGTTDRFDRFDTHNRFYGGQLGVTGTYQDGPWVVNGSVRFALGGTQQSVDILGGNSTISVAGNLLAQPSNSGERDRGEFAFVPEVRIDLGYRIGADVRVFVGYTFLYDSNMVQPGEQIDRVLPGPFGGVPTGSNRPAFSFNGSGFWAQGVDFGVEVRF
jgi:Putative beta barrel porin-7 (BBP7)